MSRMIEENNSNGTLPEIFKKYVGIKPKYFPTMRGIAMARPGWCMVEADLQTAEMRGLAFISGDEKLLKLLLEPDECWAKVDPAYVPEGIDPAECIVRLSYPDYITKRDDKYLLSYATDGKIHATFTKEQLLKDDKGNIISPSFDMHWGVVEMSRGVPREELNKKIDRGAGKVINFCIPEYSDILTDNGIKKLKDVTTDDKIWDGHSWVTHKGVVCHGQRTVITYKGLTATPDHIVWVKGEPTTFLNAATRWLDIDVSAEGDIPVTVQTNNNPDEYRKINEKNLVGKMLCTGKKDFMYYALVNSFMGTHWWINYILNHKIKPTRTPMEAAAVLLIKLLKDKASNIQNWVNKTVREFFYYVKRDCFLNFLLDSKYIEPDIKYRELYSLHREYSLVFFKSKQEMVYDIVDAGPNHRFTANGLLISNSSSYGGKPSSLARKVEAATGTQPTIESVEKMLAAIDMRQPKAAAWLEDLEHIPEREGIMVAASGRQRHCCTFGRFGNNLSGKAVSRVVTSLGRECRNFYLQESVAAVAARALKAMVNLSVNTDLQGYPCVCLYDSIVVHCPYEERHIWMKALELYMYLANGWFYNGRILRYSIDAEYNAGWSTAPDKELSDKLKDDSFSPTPGKFIELEHRLSRLIELYKINPELSVYNREDMMTYNNNLKKLSTY